MNQLAQAAAVISKALKEGRIGVPCSVRIIDHTVADHGLILASLAAGMQAAIDWLGGEVETVYATGSIEAGQISVLMRFVNGQTAWVSAGTAQDQSLLDMHVVGNKGILSWESVDEPIERVATTQPSRQTHKLLEAVDASLMLDQVITFGPSRATPRSQTDRGISESPRSKPASTIRASGIKPPYGVLVVTGSATHQETQARAFASNPRCRLVGLADEAGISPRRKALNEKLAKELKIPLLPSIDDALARQDVQIVTICAEPDRRGPIIRKCAEAGKHLFLDKPLTDSLIEADKVVAAIERAGVISHMFSYAHGTLARRARDWIKSGRLGRVTAIHCDMFFAKGHAGTAVLKPRAETAVPQSIETIEAKRELINVGVYPLVFIRWLLNRQPLRTCAVTANYFFEEHQRHDMEDFGLISLELEGGITATISAGRTGWSSHPMGGVNKVTIVGTKGAVRLDGHRPRVEVYAAEAPWLPPERFPEDPMGFWKSTPMTPKKAWRVATEEAFAAEIGYFLECIEQSRDSDVNARAGAAALELLMAAYQSAATRVTVDLPLPRS